MLFRAGASGAFSGFDLDSIANGFVSLGDNGKVIFNLMNPVSANSPPIHQDTALHYEEREEFERYCLERDKQRSRALKG